MRDSKKNRTNCEISAGKEMKSYLSAFVKEKIAQITI